MGKMHSIASHLRTPCAHGRPKRFTSSRGFTLIELLVVIVILGVISAVVVFSVGGVGDKGADAARRTDADILRTAEGAHFASRSSYGTEDQLVQAGFLSEASTIHDIELSPEPAPMGSYAIVCQAGTECSPPAAPVSGGELVVAIPGPINGVLNPAVTSEGAVHLNSEDMFNGLVGFDPAGQPVGELAESWTITDVVGGAQKATFTLRSGVFWHDDNPAGVRRPVTADDVEFSFDEALLRYHSRTSSSLGPALGVTGSGSGATVPAGSVVALDPLRVEFNFAYPVAGLLSRLNVTEAAIIPRHIYGPCADLSTVAGCPANRTPVGSGPFKFASATATEIRSEANRAYFRAGLPYLDAMVKRVVRLTDTSDEAAVSEEVTALENGTVDWIAGVGPADVNRVRDDTRLRTSQVSRTPGGANCMSMLAFNLTARGDVAAHSGGTPAVHPILGGGPGSPGHQVRSAIAQAFNRNQAFTEIDQGNGRLAEAPISSALEPAHADDVVLPLLDPTAAADRLTSAGWLPNDPAPRRSLGVPGVPDGTELVLTLRYPQNGYQAGYADSITEKLNDVGIEVDPMDTDYLGGVFTRRDFDLALVSYCQGDDPQVGVRRQYVTSQISATPFSNASGYANPAMDALWDEAARAADPATLEAKYAEIQTAAVNDLPYLWFAETRSTRAYKGSCTGFNHFNTGLFAEGAYCRLPASG